MMKQMYRVLVAVAVLLISVSVNADVLQCIPKAEMGEQINPDGHLYERDEIPNPANTSFIDFDNLYIMGAHGRKSYLVKITDTLFQSKDQPNIYFQTDLKRTVMTESNLRDSAAYVKILFCKE